MRNLAILLLRLADAWLGGRYIEVYVFGWDDDRCLWSWPEAEREPFYRHNRAIDDLRIRLQKAALRLERGA